MMTAWNATHPRMALAEESTPRLAAETCRRGPGDRSLAPAGAGR
jgi:hypothetical protein